MKKSPLFLVALALTGCTWSLQDVDRAADALKAEILSAESISPEGFAVTYYISSDGDDSADGLAPETAWRTLDRLCAEPLAQGSLVLFRRGDVWRGQINAADGVTYSSYGEGPKPCIYGSPCDGAKEGEWTLTDTPDVWVYSRPFGTDVGALVFNDGAEGCSVKQYSYGFDSDLQMYHDVEGDGLVYLCSRSGNPAERFSSIEFLTKGHCIVVGKDMSTKFDNLCIKYTGSHGIGSGSAVSLEVTNCEFGWIGGSIQMAGNNFGVEGVPTRYGNAIEIWGGCEHYLVDHNWIYQVYDAGITHQWKGGTEPVTMSDVTISNNLVEDCTYGIEYFLKEAEIVEGELPERIMKDILYTGNILRRAGYGWGTQRPDKATPALIKSWDEGGKRAENFVIENNVFDRGKPSLLQTVAAPEDLPVYRHNTYFQQKGVSPGSFPMEKTGKIHWL